jgi:hypothetical protein
MLQQTLSQKIKSFERKSLTLHVNLKRKTSIIWQIFYYSSLKFGLKLATMRKTLFDTLETSHFQQLEDLSSTHFKLSMNRRTLFHTLQTFNESKNSLPHTFTLKLATLKT